MDAVRASHGESVLMARHVLILGAGASQPFSAPLMSDFLDVARSLYAAGQVNDAKDSYARVFRAISRLQLVHSKAELDFNNLEAVFTAFEMADVIKRFPNERPEAIETLIDDLKVVIVRTLEERITFGYRHHRVRTSETHERPECRISAASEHLSFFNEAGLMGSVMGKNGTLAILTFNYDLLFDMAIMDAGLKVDYGLTEAAEVKVPSVPLLKLHGSLNWAWNIKPGAEAIAPVYLPLYFKEHPAVREPSSKPEPIQISRNLPASAALQHGVGLFHKVPFIVPPSWNKMGAYRAIAQVWSRAAAELTEAHSIYILGFSLPHTDTFFRHLYALGTVGDTLLKRFWVFNPDPSREEAFRSLLGPGARGRFEFDRMLDRRNPPLVRIAQAIRAD